LKGVNCVDYFESNDKLYLLSGSDDYTAKVWDYDSKNCVQTLEGHKNNVTAICAHPEIPIIITASEDSTVKIWDAVTYRYFIFSLAIDSLCVHFFPENLIDELFSFFSRF